MDDDHVNVMCHYCDRPSMYSKSAIQNEVKRLNSYGGFEIMTCIYCSHKFSKSDFEMALGLKPQIKSEPEVLYHAISETAQKTAMLDLERNLKCYEDQIEQEISEIKKSDEIKKMQDGKPYNEKLVGPVIDMEQGTPKDRNCVRVLKKEAELYAYTFVFIDEIVTTVHTILSTLWTLLTDLIQTIIKKINWCIACSALRIAYFIGFVGFSIVSIGTLIFTKSSLIIPYPPISINDKFGHVIWTFLTLCIVAVPLALQLAWAFTTPDSRWARVIKKRAEEIIIKDD